MVKSLKSFKVLLLLALLPVVGCSQPSANVDYETPFSNSTVTGVVSIKNNFGQSFHNVIVVLTNASGKTCNDSSKLGVILQGSFEPTFTNFFTVLAIGGDLVQVTKQYSRFGVGAYPFLRINLASFDNVNCVATVDYIGSLNPVSPPNQPSNFNAGGFISMPFSVQGGSGAGAIELVYPGAGTFNSFIPNVYGFAVINSSATAETVSVGAAPPGFCGPILNKWLDLVILPPAATTMSQVIIPNSTVPLFASNNTNRNICLVYTNAGTHAFTGYLIYRLE